MKLSRRRFLQGSSLAGLGWAAGMGAARAATRGSGPKLGEKAYASPAFSDGRIYIRAKGHLYCIGLGSTPGS